MIPQPMQQFQYGSVVRLIVQFIDPDATLANNNIPVPLNISGSANKLVCLLYPDGTTSQNFAAAFVTDGTDGEIYYDTVYNVDLIQQGLFQIQGKVTLTGDVVLSAVGYFEVLPNTDNTD